VKPEHDIAISFYFLLTIRHPERETPHPIPIKNMNNFKAVDESQKIGIDIPKAKTTNILV
jgi:hypothetical protein